MTRRERLEAKAAKREAWAQSRKAKAESAFKAADNTPLPPFGEPIKIGHHSEKRHRAALEKVHSKITQGFDHSRMAKHHESKAAGLQSQLDSSIYSDDPDAIEALEAKIAALEEKQTRSKNINAVLRKASRTGEDKAAALIAAGFTESEAKLYSTPDCMGCIGVPSYSLQNNNANIRRCRQRIEQIKAQQRRTAEAESSGGISIRRGETWCSITFAEKPSREVLSALKASGFRWGSGSWSGPIEKIPESVKALLPA